MNNLKIKEIRYNGIQEKIKQNPHIWFVSMLKKMLFTKLRKHSQNNHTHFPFYYPSFNFIIAWLPFTVIVSSVFKILYSVYNRRINVLLLRTILKSLSVTTFYFLTFLPFYGSLCLSGYSSPPVTCFQYIGNIGGSIFR